jgi:hypothetical protein
MLWTRLFAEGNIEIVKHGRDLQLLDQCPSMIKTHFDEVQSLINELTLFKEATDDLRKSDSLSLSIEEEKDRLKESLKS